MPEQKVFLHLAVISCFLSTVNVVYSKNSESTLELVHVLFRHGDRTPDKHLVYPTDPHANHNYDPIGYGQLTNPGKRKEYAIGKALRKRYKHFLGPYHPESIDPRSTAYNRTKVSLQLVLASLFPPEGDLIWDRKLRWEPAPINYCNALEDQLIGDSFISCPRYKRLYMEASDKAVKILQKQSDAVNYTMEHSGLTLSTRNLSVLYFTLSTEVENGLKLPDWASRIHPKLITSWRIVDYKTSTSTPELRKLTSGFLMKKIIEDTKAKMADPASRRKMYLYSAHECNIVFLMIHMGVYYDHIPSYGAYLIIEVHNVGGRRGIKVFYQDYQTKNPKRIHLPRCRGFCPFDKFVALYGDNLPKSEKDCFE